MGDCGADANLVEAGVGLLAACEGKIVVQLGLCRTASPGPVGVDSQVPGDRDQPGPGWLVLDVQVRAVHPGPQHRFLNNVLGAVPVSASQHGGHPQQRRPVLGVQATERGVRVVVGDGDCHASTIRQGRTRSRPWDP